ncbi:MAG: triacylglycerol lipase [Alphaproteobacteria bacterium]|nr:triacylglycerol lipase [Alphaproteobacteria bacterium]
MMSRLVQLPASDYSPTAFAKFDPAAGFSIDNARAMMWLSQLAYEAYQPDQPATIQTVGKLWGFTRVAPFAKRKVSFKASYDTCGIIGERDKAVILAFAGTDPGVWETIITDFTLRPGTDTHAGFQDAADAVKDVVAQAIALSRAGAKPLFLTGHSLGAAIAAIVALDQDARPAAVYGFGMPRPGNARFHARYTAALGERTFRFVHGLDIVARVPPSILLGTSGFRHVGHMFQCASGGKFDGAAPPAALESDDPPFGPEPSDILTAGLAALAAGNFFSPPGPGPFGSLFRFLPQPIRDHLQDRYWVALTP